MFENFQKKKKKMHSNELHLKIDENKADIPKKRHISQEQRQQTIDKLRLV